MSTEMFANAYKCDFAVEITKYHIFLSSKVIFLFTVVSTVILINVSTTTGFRNILLYSGPGHVY